MEECTTWQAAVISCFHSDSLSTGEEVPVQKTIEDLSSELEMEPPLINSALKFWLSKLVLQESPPGSKSYSVLETLSATERARSDALASGAPHASTSNEDADNEDAQEEKGIRSEHSKIYWQFVQSMLTNSSSQMGAPQIAMMLKMLIAEGFPYSNEELLEWLGGKVEEGGLECSGGRYRLRK